MSGYDSDPFVKMRKKIFGEDKKASADTPETYKRGGKVMKEKIGPSTMGKDVEKFPQFASHESVNAKHGAGHKPHHEFFKEHAAGHDLHHEAVAKMCGGGMAKGK